MALHDPPIEFPFIDMSTGFVTEPWVEWLTINKRDKANRVENGTEDNVVTLDADGHPQDSSIVLAGVALVGTTDAQELANKTFAELVSTKILSSDGSGGLAEIDLDDWINGTASQVTITDGGDGTITISLPAPLRVPATGANYLSILADGAPVFVGTSGLCYGSLYLHEGADNVDISTAGQGVYVKITGFTSGLTNNVTINSDAFNVGYVGVYKVNWKVSGDSVGNNKIYEVDIFVNGVEQSDGSGRKEFGALGSLGELSGSAIIDITDTAHDIDIRMKEPGAGVGTDFDIYHLNFNIVQIGGT